MPLKNYLIFLFLLTTVSLTAQADSLRAPADSLGEWRTLQSYRFGTYVTESENPPAKTPTSMTLAIGT